MKKTISTACLALLGLALPASAATVQANLNDLVLGFRATGGTGQTLNLEVNLGSVSLYVNPAGSPMTITKLAAADIAGTYGADWNTRTDLFWGVVGTAGRTGSGGPEGQSLATLWVTRPEATVGTQSTPFTPSSRNGQSYASSIIESVFQSAPGSLNGATSTSQSSVSAKINSTLAGSYTVQDTTQAGVSFGLFNPTIDNTVVSSGWSVSDLYELQPGAGSATYLGSFGLKADGTLVFAVSPAYFTTESSAPTISSPPVSTSAAAGAAIQLSVTATGSPTYDWQQNGTDVEGGSTSSISIPSLSSADTGLYTVTLANDGGTITSRPTILGLDASSEASAGGDLLATNIPHPNGNHYDQILMTAASTSFTTDGGRVTRMSYIDGNNDIVQIEYSGPGTVSVVLAGSSGPAAPVNYNQPTVDYMKGHAGIVVTGADEFSNLLVFTVGRVTAFDPSGGYNFLLPISETNNPANNGSSLFTGEGSTNYDGIADLAFVAISSTNGKFGGLRLSNTALWSDKGIVGIYAPGVDFQGPVYVENIDAMGTATPYLVIGSSAVRVGITGGNLKQDNERPVHIAGFTQLHFQAGLTSNNVSLPSQASQAQYVDIDGNSTADPSQAPE